MAVATVPCYTTASLVWGGSVQQRFISDGNLVTCNRSSTQPDESIMVVNVGRIRIRQASEAFGVPGVEIRYGNMGFSNAAVPRMSMHRTGPVLNRHHWLAQLTFCAYTAPP